MLVLSLAGIEPPVDTVKWGPGHIEPLILTRGYKQSARRRDTARIQKGDSKQVYFRYNYITSCLTSEFNLTCCAKGLVSSMQYKPYRVHTVSAIRYIAEVFSLLFNREIVKAPN